MSATSTGTWAAARDTLRQLGWVDAGVYGLGRGLARVSRDHIRLDKHLVVAQQVQPKPRLPGRIGSDIRIRVLEPGDPIRASFPRDAAAIDHHLRQGVTCLVATRDGQFVGYHWLALGGYDEDQFRARLVLEPAAQMAWNFDLFVEPAFRLGPAFLRLWDASHAWLAERGATWVLSRIAATNHTSWQAHRRMGAVALGWLLTLQVGGWQCLYCHAAGCHRLVATLDAAPTLTLHAPPPQS